MKRIKVIFLVLPFLTACEESPLPAEGPEIVVIGNGAEYASGGVSDRLLADVASEGRLTSLIVEEGTTKPAIQNSETGEALEVKVTDAHRDKDGSELIRISQPSQEIMGCNIFERSVEGQLVCREDLQEMPLDEKKLPLFLEADSDERAVFKSEAGELRYGDAETSSCISASPEEFFVKNDRLFFRSESQWNLTFFEELDRRSGGEACASDFGTKIQADEVFSVGEEVFAFRWKDPSTPRGLYRVDLEAGASLDEVWHFEESEEILEFKKKASPLRDGSLLASVSFRNEREQKKALLHLHPHLKKDQSFFSSLTSLDSETSIGHQKLFVRSGETMETCHLVSREDRWSWSCQPLELDFDKRIESVALDQEDHLVVALQGESDELWSLRVEDLSFVGREVLEGRFLGFRKILSQDPKKSSQGQAFH